MMYSNDHLRAGRNDTFRRWNKILAALMAVPLVWVMPTRGAPLMEEGFNFPAGSYLATNSPWAGSANAALSIAAGSLSVTNLRSIFPNGNQLQLTGAATANARVNFALTAVSNTLYCSFLINCSTLPTGQQFLTSFLRSGGTSASPPDDALDLYVQPSGGGYSFTLTAVGSDPSSSGTILLPNTTHLVVMKYSFANRGRASLFIDPAPGGAETFPNISAGADDNTGPASLQVLLFHSTAGQGTFGLDTVRVGTNWSDVTPAGIPLTLTGPFDQAICAGSPATFSVAAVGTPPFYYQWRTNGVALPGATNTTFFLAAPGMINTSNLYDVVVQDSFSYATSRVAGLTISSLSAAIQTQPSNPVVTPTSTNAVFTVTAVGDAPLVYQWRTNGVAISGATNSNYVVTNLAAVDPTLQYDVVVSNPCGTVTSSPPAKLVFPSVFYAAYDAGPGFFSGENLVLTNSGGLTLQAWSSPSLSTPITGWNFEGALQEQPLNDGTGKSYYSINVTPAASPVYYIFGASVASPYLAPIPILTITSDPNGFYLLDNSQMGISSNGILGTPAPELSATSHAGGGLDFSATGAPGATYWLQAATNFTPPLFWFTVQTNLADQNGVVRFSETNLSGPLRFYRLLGQ